jgi:hypothetical protein
MENNPQKAPRIFISYCHKPPETKQQVLEFSQRLRQNGVDSRIDQYEQPPPVNWPRWMMDQVEEADFVLVLCTEEYHKRFRGKETPGVGKGVNFEGAIITQELYDAAGGKLKFLPILFSTTDEKHIPVNLKSGSRYDLTTSDGFNDLMLVLTDQKTVIPSPLGPIPVLGISSGGKSAGAGGSAAAAASSTPTPSPAAAASAPAIALAKHSVNEIFDKDAAVCIPAATAFAASATPAEISAIVARLKETGQVSRQAARLILKNHAAESAPAMIEAVKNASSHWGAASSAADCFDPAHDPHASQNLGKFALSGSTDWDAQRLAVTSVGNMGASGYGYLFLEKFFDLRDPPPSEYMYSKFLSYVLESLARMFVLEKDVREHSPGFYTLEAGLVFVEKYGWKGDAGLPHRIERMLYSCKPAHADVLLRQWLRSKTKLLRRYTAGILGQIRLFRAIPSLKDRLDDPEESHEVVENAATSLGNIGGSETVRTLWAACDRFKGKQEAANVLVACRRGLSFCLEQEEDPQTFRAMTLDLLSEPRCQHWLCYRAVGIKKNDSLVDELRKALLGTESVDRGAALLALARLGVKDALQLAKTFYDQAADSWESIFAALAMLTIDPKLLTPNLLSKLRADLATESVNYMRHAREDIISTLRSLDHPEATLMADSWAYAYRPTIDY